METVSNMSDFSTNRIFKVLDGISDRLNSIDSRLEEVVRLEERVKSHDEILSRMVNRSDTIDHRIRELELGSVSYHSLNSDLETVKTRQRELEFNHSTIANLKIDLQALKDQHHKLLERSEIVESFQNRMNGQKSVWKEVLKWFAGLLAAMLVYSLTNGSGSLINVS